ncbi:MAG: protein jag [Bacteroidetes bacterium]|nr:protein jag [Bacteroidota bacterium]
MIREFEGKTEQEAIDNAIKELNLGREDFDVEVIESEKKGLFRKGSVTIRIHVEEAAEAKEETRGISRVNFEASDDFEKKVVIFVNNVLLKMGFPGAISIAFRRDYKLGLNIDSKDSGIIIGKKGKNLDALQLLTNVYSGQLDNSKKVVIDSENYRLRHEEYLVKLAYKTAEQVKDTKRSRLLEPMNPFERRLIHTALNDILDIDTRSEGDGLYKQVRVFYKGLNT